MSAPVSETLNQWSVKHRPRRVEDLLATSSTLAQIKHIITKAKRDAHALLIVGPSGTGKTTVAKIIAGALTKGATADLSERNVGDTRGVDDVRSLVQEARYLPSIKGGRRVFILDEVHALTGAAASALLKPLEEPHPHVTWILCTDQPERLLPSIVNRCLTLRLDYADPRDLKRMLLRVLEKEKALQKKPLKVRGKLCAAIAEASGNVPRQAVQMLQSAVASAGEYKTVKELIAHSVNGAGSPHFDLNRSISRVILALLLAGTGKDTLKVMLTTINTQDSFVFLNRLLMTVTAVLMEVVTGERQSSAYFVIDGARKVNLKSIDPDHLMLIQRRLASAQASAVTFTVDSKALTVAACCSAYTDLARTGKR